MKVPAPKIKRRPKQAKESATLGAGMTFGASKMTKPDAPKTSMPAGLNFGEIANYDGAERTITGTSIFDPVLCELAYRWFCPPGGLVLDPFAGGSVRGVVASKLGRRYLGVDLRPEQVEANTAQAKRICKRPLPSWVVGDSAKLDLIVPKAEADFLFSCPPYGDLERYSDDPADISTMEHEAFVETYSKIIALACSRLLPNRFACFVVGDFRDARGMYRNFPGETVDAFRAAGLELYNWAILVTAVGSLPVRINKQFTGSRKLGKTHQDVLVFIKGDPKIATEAVGDAEFGELLDLALPAGRESDQYGERLTSIETEDA